MAANVVEILILAHDVASEVFSRVGEEATSLSGRLTEVGSALTVATAGIAAVLAGASTKAIAYEESMTNTAAVLGLTREEQSSLSKEILDFSRNTRDGPQAVADAFYDIVGGVADASTHMAILTAASRTAEAGNANLAGTTAGLISIMNSYKMSADGAAYASDVMTQIVGAGVGTMDEFASALPGVTGLAASLGISFDSVGGSMAFLTTQGFSASIAATQLRSVMVSMLNPNESMKAALDELGYSTGQAAIEALGLSGAMSAISGTNAVVENGLAKTLGSVEALTGVIALNSEAGAAALETFSESFEGATDAAREIQLSSTAAQFDLLNSSLAAIAIQIGTALLPSINNFIASIRPVLDSVFEWIAENPKLLASVLSFTGVLIAAGPVLSGIGATIAILTSPVGALITAITLLGTAWATNFGGVRDIVEPVLATITEGLDYLLIGIRHFTEDVGEFGILDAIMGAFGLGKSGEAEGGQSWVEGVLFNFGVSREAAEAATAGMQVALLSISNFVTNTAIPALQQFADWFLVTALPAVISFVNDVVVPGIESLIETVTNIWSELQLPLTLFADWFLVNALPSAINFVTNTVIPGVESFITTISDIWNKTQPALESLFDWFTISALPGVLSFITDMAIPFIDGFIQTLIRIWDDVSPFLISLADWFLTSALPAVINYIQTIVIPVWDFLITTMVGLWTAIQPGLASIYDWFVTTALPAIIDMLDSFVIAFEFLTAALSAIWMEVEPGLTSIYNWFVTDGIPAISLEIGFVIEVFELLVSTISNIWAGVQPFLLNLQNGIAGIFNWIRTNVIDPFISAISGIANAWTETQTNIVNAAAMLGINLDGGGTTIVGGSFGQTPGVSIGGFTPQIQPSWTAANGTSVAQSNPNYQISVNVTERELLTQSDVQTNGRSFGRRVMEELNRRG